MADNQIEVEYDLDLPPEVIQGKLFALGQLISKEMRELALRMGLKDTWDYSQGFLVTVKQGVIIIENRVAYAEALEFGTYEYNLKFGKEKFPKKPDPKKKDLTGKEKKGLPKGMQPFGVFRRVLYNKELMNSLINQVFK